MVTAPRRLAAASLVAPLAWLALGACESAADRDSSVLVDSTEEPVTDIEVTPDPPSWSGTRTLLLAAGSKVLTPLRCVPEPDERLVCSVDGDTYAFVGTPREVTLRSARAVLDSSHTSWRTVLRFAPGSEAALAEARERARAEGSLLVQVPGGPVLTVLPVPTVAGRSLLLQDVEKPEAWEFVRELGGS